MEVEAVASAQRIEAENKCYVVLQQAGIWERQIQPLIPLLCTGISVPKKQGDSPRRVDIPVNTIALRSLAREQAAPSSPV